MRNQLVVGSVIVALSLGGCASMTETQKGTAKGAGIGAGVGAVVGAIAGKGKGAAIGAVVGAGVGAVAGELKSTPFLVAQQAFLNSMLCDETPTGISSNFKHSLILFRLCTS